MFSLGRAKTFYRGNFQRRTKGYGDNHEGLTIDLCHRIKADFILRGLRNPADFEFKIAHTTDIYQNRNSVLLIRSSVTTSVHQFEYQGRDVIRMENNKY
jgi:pantetheine-phosphate adenylyltransferase